MPLRHRSPPTLLGWRGLAAIVAIAFAAVLGASSPVSAHADLESTDPAPGSLLAQAPTSLTLRFTEAVDSVPGGIRIVASDGRDVALPEPTRADGSDATLRVELPALSDGTYVVAWRAVSADSHPVAGSFTFSVGIETDPASGVIGEVLDARAPAGSSALLAVGRWASYIGIAVVVGLVAFVLWFGSLISPRRMLVATSAATMTAAIGTAVMIAAQSVVTRDRWGALVDIDAWRITIDSHAGRWWAVRTVLVVGIGLAAILLTKSQRRRAPVTACWAAASLILLAVTAAGGHAVSGRAVAAGLTATVVHLAAMSVWVGGLTGVLLVSGPVRTLAARAFSKFALASVIALVATGLFNAWRQVGTLHALTSTDYGRWLMIKSALVVAVLIGAAVARALVHRPAGDPASGRIHRVLVYEVAVLATVLAVTALLVNSPPARAVATQATTVTMIDGDRSAQITLDPATTGGTTMHVYVTSLDQSQPDEIVVQISLPARDIAPYVLDTYQLYPGHVTNPAADFPLPGTWTIEIRARYGEFDLISFESTVEID